MGLVVALAGSGVLASGTPAQAAEQRQESVLRNTVKGTYLGIKPFGVYQVWVDTDPTGSLMTYAAPGTTGPVVMAGTCVLSTATPSGVAGFFGVFPAGDESNCLRFKTLMTSPTTFTLRVDDPRSSANGNYLGDGDRGGVLDLLSTSPLMQFDVPLVEDPGLSVAASGTVTDVDGDGRPSAGDRVTYRAAVTNTGNADLTNVRITTEPSDVVFSCPPAPLTPRGVVECTSDTGHVLTQADIDAGAFTLNLTANALSPTGKPVSSPTSVRTPITADAEIGVVRTGVLVDTNHNGHADAGERVTYTVTVTNPGALTLTGVTVTDDLLGAIDCPIAPLAPGATITCDDTGLTLTQAHIDSGSITGTTTATGTDPAGQPATASADTTVALDAAPAALKLELTATLGDTNGNALGDAGESITYAYTVTNPGGTTLESLVVTDSRNAVITCESATLAVDRSTTCTAPNYTITAKDADARRVVNTAKSVATSVTNATLTATADATTATTVPAATPQAQVLAFTGTDLTPLLVTVLVFLLHGATTLTIRTRLGR